MVPRGIQLRRTKNVELVAKTRTFLFIFSYVLWLLSLVNESAALLVCLGAGNRPMTRPWWFVVSCFINATYVDV
jgi:hypothetical protein